MRLTPADVHNVAFKKPSIGKRGYDEDEVDAFLDIVEAELTSLIEENNDLREQLAAGGSGAAPVGAGADDGAAAQLREQNEQLSAQLGQAAQENAQLREHIVTLQNQLQNAGAQAQPAPVAAAAPQSGPSDHHLQAARLLEIAQQTADQVVAAANSEADQTLTSARSESERMLSEANASSDSIVTGANEQAEATIRDAQIKAEAIDRDSQRKYSEVMSQLTSQRTSLENKIDALRTYEREYRSRLKSWISDQLQQLDATGTDGES